MIAFHEQRLLNKSHVETGSKLYMKTHNVTRHGLQFPNNSTKGAVTITILKGDITFK